MVEGTGMKGPGAQSSSAPYQKFTAATAHPPALPTVIPGQKLNINPLHITGHCVIDIPATFTDSPRSNFAGVASLVPPANIKRYVFKMEQESKMRLKEWLITQIDSKRYEGLSWEDEGKTMFRIPWKHAAKKDYKQKEDAALFKAWAVYKGKHREGRDRADPTMWKTRLRCALNKSTDFQEVPERSQLDISEPFKVYRIHPDNEPVTAKDSVQGEHPEIIQPKRSSSPPRTPILQDTQLQCQRELFQARKEERNLTENLMREHMYCELTAKRTQSQSSAALSLLSPTPTISDFRMQVKLFYHGQMVMKVTTSSPDGCFILHGGVPLGNERIYGPCRAQQLAFPSPALICLQPGMAEAMARLLCHLERGVLLWVAPEGVFIKRFCQGRVYWNGPLAQHTDRPNKLDRERTFKLLDMPIFVSALQAHLQGGGPAPRYEIELCFGEEFPDPSVPKTKKLIMVQVVPLFAVELLQRFHMGETEEKRHTLTLNTDRDEM
ncbi:interferon regulatory factor 10 isoform X1 [Myripristis murdjan]|nr:interferon regulatory factor 4-like isoform X1 [Myripristis murdjan]